MIALDTKIMNINKKYDKQVEKGIENPQGAQRKKLEQTAKAIKHFGLCIADK